MGKRYKYVDGYLSRDLIHQKIHQLRDAAFGADCLTPVRILKMITFTLKMESSNTVKEFYMLQNLSAFNLQSF